MGIANSRTHRRPLAGLPAHRLGLQRALPHRQARPGHPIAGIGLLVLAPFFPLIALAIKLDSAGPIFYTCAFPLATGWKPSREIEKASTALGSMINTVLPAIWDFSTTMVLS